MVITQETFIWLVSLDKSVPNHYRHSTFNFTMKPSINVKEYLSFEHKQVFTVMGMGKHVQGDGVNKFKRVTPKL